MKEHAKNCATSGYMNMAAGAVIPRECDCDGYHTFKELYDHRVELFITLCRWMSGFSEHTVAWRSKLHADGSEYKGWFIMGIGKSPGKQISYHLPLSRWDDTSFAETLANAPEWDGHTSADVLERLKSL